MTVSEDLATLFGDAQTAALSPSSLSSLLHQAWHEQLNCQGLRAHCWRIFLGLVSHTNKFDWSSQLQAMTDDYQQRKDRLLPRIANVQIDPLSQHDPTDPLNEWTVFYKQIELTEFIKGDLDRLYLSGIDDDYFQTKARRDMVLNILFLWSAENNVISYRQGMHEIVGCLLYLVELEELYFRPQGMEALDTQHYLYNCFGPHRVEALTYALFARIMMELASLYDPLPVYDGQPFVVQYCAKIQEHYLRILDPQLAQHLEESFVQSQLYGLRWSRLLLGREFPVTHTHVFRLWDFMFASCFAAEYQSDVVRRGSEEDDIVPNVYSLFANAVMRGYQKDTNDKLKKSGTTKLNYVCTPLLGALGDLMLAMLIQIREELLNSDSNSVITYVMRYPQRESVGKLLECADMIRRNVLVRDITANGAVLNDTPFKLSHPLDNPEPTRGSIVADVLNSHVGRRVTDRLNFLKTAVGTGLSDIVQSIAPLLEAPPSTSTAGDAHHEYAYRSDGETFSSVNPLSDQSIGSAALSSLSAQRAAALSTATSTKRSNPLAVTRKKVQDPLSASADESDTVDETASTSTPTSSAVVIAPQTTTSNSSSPSGGSPSKESVEEIDPLTGMVLSKSSSSPTPVKRGSLSSSYTGATLSTTQLRGEGTGYGKMSSEESLLLQSTTASSAAAPSSQHHSAHTNALFGSPTAAPERKGLSLFSPHWFPSSSNKTAAKKAKDRMSVGVDLQPIGSDDNDLTPASAGSGVGGSSSGVIDKKERSTALRAKGNAVKDRLMEIADHLIAVSGTVNSVGSEDREDVCVATARRLIALASVLGGDASIVDFDTKFANKELPSLLPATRQRRDSAVSVMSDSSSVGAAVLTATAMNSVVMTSKPTNEEERGEDQNGAVDEEDEEEEEMQDLESIASETAAARVSDLLSSAEAHE